MVLDGGKVRKNIESADPGLEYEGCAAAALRGRNDRRDATSDRIAGRLMRRKADVIQSVALKRPRRGEVGGGTSGVVECRRPALRCDILASCRSRLRGVFDPHIEAEG